ncbi:MAG: aldose epimerase family protein [Eubacteriales bacterium]|nr:aldose epimerase family protein [Eubacteriales bacterium]
MAISEKNIGIAPSGDEAVLYTIVNKNGTEASFCNIGAVWVSMLVPDKNGKLGDVLLGYDTADGIYNNPESFGVIVGRNANRIAKGRFKLNGKEYQLALNNNGNNLHSGPEVFGKRCYKALKNEAENSIIFSLVSEEGDQGYPGELVVEVKYELTDEDELIISYRLEATTEDTVANMTCHPYFNLAGHASGSALEQEMQIFADEFCEIDETVLASGTIAKVENTAFDFREPKMIGTDIKSANMQLKLANGYDHNFCIRDYDGSLRQAAVCYDRNSGRKMTVYTNMPGIQLYTGNFLDENNKAKEGVYYKPYDGYALETQYYPNAINVPEWKQPVIHKNEVQNFETRYCFSIE